MFVCGPTAQIVRGDFNKSGKARSPDNSKIKDLSKEVWKDCDDVKL
jgi:hypothetical protein